MPFFRKVFLKRKRRVLRRMPRALRERGAYLLHKERARTIVHERLAYWMPLVGVTPGRIAIRDQRSRWGSCSTKGNLNFNYRIVFLPLELIDYIIVHELCHLHEFNHSPQFWLHVEMHVPAYELHKKALHEFTAQLNTTGNTAIVAS